MKTPEYLPAILLFLIGSALSIQAQDSIVNRSVSVEREYQPMIHDAGKINSMPLVLEPNVVKSPANYSNFNLPLNADYNIHILPAAELIPEKPPLTDKGFARIGVGNFSNTLADFAYPLINTPDIRLDFSLNHLATFDTRQMHSTTKANLSFDKIFKTFDLYAGVGGGHEYFKYYGNNYNSVDSIINLEQLAVKYENPYYEEISRIGINTSQRSYSLDSLSRFPNNDTFWRFNAQVGLRSLPMSTDLRYQAEIQYKLFRSLNGMTENIVRTQAGFSTPNEKNRLGLDFDLSNMMYSSVKIPDFNYWDTYAVLTLNPYFKIDRPTYNVRLGIKSSFSFVHGSFVNPSADVNAEWKAIPEYLSIYGGMTGDYEINTLDKIFTENPYLLSDIRLTDTYTPVDFYAGIKLKPLYNLLLDGYIDFKQIDNQYFFVNNGYSVATSNTILYPSDETIYTNRFSAVYSSATRFKAGVRANYNYKKQVNIELKYAYNGWTVENQPFAWNKPKYEAQLNTDLRVNDNLTVSANMYYEGTRYARLGYFPILMQDKVDINLGVAYSYNNWLTVFGKINNLINNQYQNYYGYDVQGTNMMIGAAFSF